MGINKGARPSVLRACHHFCMSFCNKISGEKKVSKELSILLFSFSCASHTVKLYYLEYILWRYWPQAGPTFIGLYPGNSEKQPLRNRNPYASWKWSERHKQIQTQQQQLRSWSPICNMEMESEAKNPETVIHSAL